MKQIMNFIAKEKKMIYLLSILFIMLISYMICIVFDAKLFEQIFFHNIRDSFMDYFNCFVGYNPGNPFDAEIPTNYPAMAVIFYKIITRGTPIEMQAMSPMELKLYQYPWLILLIYTILLLFICRVVLLYKMRLKNYERIILELVLILSYPVMYAFERGNVINVAFVLTLFFVAYYDDKNVILKELAYIALAIATSIKIYPAIFGLLLVKRKKIKETIRLAIYGILCMVVPFLYFGGISMVLAWFQGLLGFANAFSGSMETTETVGVMLQYGYGYNYSLQNMLQVFLYLMDINIEASSLKIIMIPIYVLLMIAAFFAKQRWKELLCYAILLIIVPGVSGTYALLFLIIPFLIYINSLAQKNRRTGRYDILGISFLMVMAIIFIPWPIPYIEKCNVLLENGAGPLPFQSLISYISICLLSILIIADLVNNICLIFIKKSKMKKTV